MFRLLGLLKQWTFEPVVVAKQVCAIYAASKWHLDEIEVSKIKKAESDLYLSLDEEKTILDDITKNGKMSEVINNPQENYTKILIEANFANRKFRVWAVQKK